MLVVASCGQVDPESNAKFVAMLGLFPVVGGEIVRIALPIFETVAVCGLSVESDSPIVVAVGYVSAD